VRPLRLAARGPFRPGVFRSPLRGPWLTAVLGITLLGGLSLVLVTGLLSYAAYNPGLAGNDKTPDADLLGAYLFPWPARPHWLYRLNQGTHVTLGLVLVPVLLAKLWSVLPKLFELPPVRSVAQALERLSLLLLVGGGIFEFVTGVLNIQYWYVFPGSFYRLHLYGAWVFTAALAAHVVLKLPRAVEALRSRSFREVLHTDTAGTAPEPPDPDHLVSPDPAPATISRRGALGLVAASSLAVLLVTVGQSLGGAWRRTALLAPRGQDPGVSELGVQVNKTASAAGVRPEQTLAATWALTLAGGAGPVRLTLAQLAALPQRTSFLPIACVEGWSTEDLAWTGVPLRDLAALAGVPDPASVHVQSLQEGGFGSTRLRRNQVLHPDSLLALRLQDVELPLDHGYPARVIVPANPGVHNTKWVTSLTFEA